MTNKKETMPTNTNTTDEPVTSTEPTPEEIQVIKDKIHLHVDNAYASLAKAEALSREHNVSFSFRPAYGMGGYFDPDPRIDEWGEECEAGWCPSSASC